MRRRVLESIGFLLAGTIAVFALLRASGGPMASYVTDPHITPERIAVLHHQFGPNQPVFLQYVAWLGRVLHGDLGWSRSNAEPVTQAITERLPFTIELAGAALALAVLLGALGGAMRARVRQPLVSGTLAVLELIVRSFPAFLSALLLLAIAILYTKLPAAGVTTPLPLFLLTVLFGAWASSLVHDFLRTRGDARFSARDVSRPVAECVALLAPALLGTTVLAETLFAWPGTGRLFENAFAQWDVPLVAGILLFYWTAIVLMKLFAGTWLAIVGEPRPRIEPPPTRTTTAWRSFVAHRVAAFGLVVCGALALIAIVGSFVSPDPYFIDTAHWSGYPLPPGTAGHLLGTDENARDLFARLLLGLRTSLAIAVFAALVATAFGLAIAPVAKRLSWFSGHHALSVAGIRPLAAFPFIAVAIGVILTNKLPLHVAVLTLLIAAGSWPTVVAAVRERSASLVQAVLCAAAGVTAGALLLEITLSFMGLGVQPPTPSLGNMLVNANTNLAVAPWAIFWPAVTAIAALFALNAVADGLRHSEYP